MTSKPFYLKKRTLMMMVALLSGAALAGFLSAVLETPQNDDDFLHDHLAAMSHTRQLKWTAADLDLPAIDKTQIGKIISEQRSETCQFNSKVCKIEIRVNRRLHVDHLNADYRVVNIKETGLRVDLERTPDKSDVVFKGMSEENRILRFYQTQSGWELTATDSLDVLQLDLEKREHTFNDRFQQRWTGLNYYPTSASWGDFWKNFPVEEIRSDLAVARGLNVNALRIFLTHAYFDAADTRDDALSKLNIFLDLCAEENIKVLVTLFDLRPNYALLNWDADIEHIDFIFSDIADHPAILAVDLKNQPDLDFQSWGTGQVEAWLTVMARYIQIQFPDIPVTTGWSQADHATRLKDVFDLVTYHEYQNSEGFSTRLESVKSAVGRKSVMITELGSTIWQPPFIETMGETDQAKRLRKQLDQAGEANGVFVWTLNDFDHVDTDVVGPLPWRKAQQKHYGLIRADGSARPAASVLKSFAESPLSNSNQK